MRVTSCKTGHEALIQPVPGPPEPTLLWDGPQLSLRLPLAAITRTLKLEDHAGRNAQILLRLRGGASCSEARQEVIHLDGTNGEMFCQLGVKPATYRHGKAIVRSVCRGSTCAHAFCAEEHLAKRRDAVPVAVRNPRAKKIGGQREVKPVFRTLPL